jgi:hypothetical protein
MIKRESLLSREIQLRRYAAEFSIVRFSIPVTPQSIAAPTSATRSSRLYDSEPKD